MGSPGLCAAHSFRYGLDLHYMVAGTTALIMAKLDARNRPE